MVGTRIYATLLALLLCSLRGGYAIRPAGILRLPGDEGQDFTGKRKRGNRAEPVNPLL